MKVSEVLSSSFYKNSFNPFNAYDPFYPFYSTCNTIKPFSGDKIFESKIFQKHKPTSIQNILKHKKKISIHMNLYNSSSTLTKPIIKSINSSHIGTLLKTYPPFFYMLYIMF